MSGWKPGDLAISMVLDTPHIIFRGEGRWYDKFGPLLPDGEWVDGRDIRPLVVIDPEKDADIDRLARILADNSYAYNGPLPAHDMLRDISCLQAALREFASPPTIEEPTGLGAVVEDANGRLWVRAEKAKGMQNPWQDTLSDDPASDRIRAVAYAEISVVRVLSEGIS